MITPPWLGFTMISGGDRTELHAGAEFKYTICWLGVKIGWHSRITEYVPGRRFTDVQVRGPYRSWVHRHHFEKIPTGTLVVDLVDFTLPLPGLLAAPLIQRQLVEIFTYRRRRIEEWASGGDGALRAGMTPARVGSD